MEDVNAAVRVIVLLRNSETVVLDCRLVVRLSRRFDRPLHLVLNVQVFAQCVDNTRP